MARLERCILLMLDLILEATVLISVATISCFLKKNIQMLIVLQFVLNKNMNSFFFLNNLSNIDIHIDIPDEILVV